jgi:hypothetical protein
MLSESLWHPHRGLGPLQFSHVITDDGPDFVEPVVIDGDEPAVEFCSTWPWNSWEPNSGRPGGPEENLEPLFAPKQVGKSCGELGSISNRRLRVVVGGYDYC